MSTKFLRDIKAGSTDLSVFLELIDSTDGSALVAKTFGDVTAYYCRQGGSPTIITPVTLASPSAAHADGGFVKLNDTNMPGVYRFDIPDAAIVSGADSVVLSITVAGAFPQNFEYFLTDSAIQTGDTYARLGAPAGASISADIATADTVVDGIQADLSNGTDGLGALKALIDAILADTSELQTNQGDWATATGFAVPGDAMALTAGERVTLAAAIEAAIINELDGTAVMQAIADLIADDMTTGDLSVQAIATATRDAILDRILSGNHDAADTLGKIVQDILADTGADIPAAITALNDLSSAEAQSAAAAALTAYDPPTNAEMVARTLPSADYATDAKQDTIIAGQLSQADVRTAVGLAAANLDTQLSGLSSHNAADVADAVWDELQTGHTTVGTFGYYLDAVVSAIGGGGGDATEAKQDTIIAALAIVDNLVDLIKAKTDNLPADPAGVSDLPSVPSAADNADAVLDELLTGHTTAGSLGKAIADILEDSSTSIPGLIAALNNLSAADVNAEVDQALAAYDGPTKTEMDLGLASLQGALETAIGNLNDPTTAEIATAVEAAILNEGDATALLAAIAAKVEEFLINDGDAAATMAAIATAVRTEIATELARLDVAVSTRNDQTPLTAAGIRAAMGLAAANLDTQLATIVGDTNELQADWTDGGRLDLLLDAVQTAVNALNNLSEAEVTALLDAYDAPTSAEMVAAFTEIKGAGWDSATDTLEQIRDSGGGGGGGAAPWAW